MPLLISIVPDGKKKKSRVIRCGQKRVQETENRRKKRCRRCVSSCARKITAYAGAQGEAGRCWRRGGARCEGTTAENGGRTISRGNRQERVVILGCKKGATLYRGAVNTDPLSDKENSFVEFIIANGRPYVKSKKERLEIFSEKNLKQYGLTRDRAIQLYLEREKRRLIIF